MKLAFYLTHNYIKSIPGQQKTEYKRPNNKPIREQYNRTELLKVYSQTNNRPQTFLKWICDLFSTKIENIH